MSDITKQNISAKNVELSLSILPLLPYISLSSGISEEGVQWEDIEVANYKQGADGLVGINTKPIVYTGTLNLMANSSQRQVLNDILQLTIARPGIKANRLE
jgi:tagatose-1,6-bisphosphate aldolase